MGELRQREPRLELPALTRTARGQACTMRVENVCNGRAETTVWAHSNQYRHGKALRGKSHDCFGAWMCSACHDWYDGRTHDDDRHDRQTMFEFARDRTLYELFKQGKLKVVK